MTRRHRTELRGSWVYESPSVRDLARRIDINGPFTLRGALNQLRSLEARSFSGHVRTPGNDHSATDADVTLWLWSNGDWKLTGTAYSNSWVEGYEYTVFVKLRQGNTILVSATTSDRVGINSQDNFEQHGTSPGIVSHWAQIRNGGSLEGFITGRATGFVASLKDVGRFLVEIVIASWAFGTPGVGVLLAAEAVGFDPHPGVDDLPSIIGVAGALFITGPFGALPAVLVGRLTQELTAVKHRQLRPPEVELLKKVFGESINPSSCLITNLGNPDGSCVTVPTIGGTILLNMTQAGYDSPNLAEYKPKDSNGNVLSDYSSPGEVFVHELTHAWQISHQTLFEVGVVNYSTNYNYVFDAMGNPQSDRNTYRWSWENSEWGSFKNEQQAHIIEDWYGAHWNDLGSFEATADPAFHFVDHLRGWPADSRIPL
jgi:hypothetical protein